MNDSPPLILMMIAASAYFAWLWWTDYRATQRGEAPRGALPGTTPTTARAVIIAVVGAGLIVAAETWGEIHLGLSAEQSQITVLFGIYTLFAAIVEEIIFRGFVVPAEHRGRVVLWLVVIGASVVFALIHPFLWTWDDEGLQFDFGAKAWFSTAAVFVSSLWFYFVRFMPANPTRSLLPCFAAHATKNLAVFAIKAAQGFVVGWI